MKLFNECSQCLILYWVVFAGIMVDILSYVFCHSRKCIFIVKYLLVCQSCAHKLENSSIIWSVMCKMWEKLMCLFILLHDWHACWVLKYSRILHITDHIIQLYPKVCPHDWHTSKYLTIKMHFQLWQKTKLKLLLKCIWSVSHVL